MYFSGIGVGAYVFFRESVCIFRLIRTVAGEKIIHENLQFYFCIFSDSIKGIERD